MPTPSIDDDLKAEADKLLLAIAGVTVGKMFGYPVYLVDKKMFACVYGAALAVKVPEDMVQGLLAQAHIEPFVPMGRRSMKQWVLITHASPKDYRRDLKVLKAAAEYVRGLAAKSG